METSPPRPPRPSPPRSSTPRRSPPRGSPPRTSPPRTSPPRNSPPKRASPSPRASPTPWASSSPRASPTGRRGALHERSESRNNERSARMLRMVGNPEASTYGANPYPTKPSHILPPKPSTVGGGPPSPYEMMIRAQSRLSEHTRDTWVPSNATRARRNEAATTPRTPVTPNQPEGYFEQDQRPDPTFYATSTDDSSGGAKTPDQDKRASYHEDTASTPEPTAGKSFLEPRSSNESSDKGRPSGESVVQLPSVPLRADEPEPPMSSSMTEPFSEEYHVSEEHPPVPPRAEGHINPIPSPVHSQFHQRQPSNKESDNSLGSANSTGTMVVKKPRDGKKRASYSAFPTARPSSSKSTLPPSTPTKPYRNDSEESVAPHSPVSPSSPVSEEYSTTRPISSVPAYSNLQAANSKSLGVQYPVVEPPRASRSWAHVANPPQRPPKAAERDTGRWNPHLSTVISLGSSSPTADRDSQGTWPLESSRGSKTSSSLTKWSPRISSDFPPVPRRSSELSAKEISQSPPVPPMPSRLASPPPVQQRNFTGSTIRKVDENKVSSFSPPSTKPPPSGKTSVLQSPDPQGDRKGSSATFAKRSSTASFFKELPSWAKSYYARPDSTIFERSGSRTSADILNMMSGRKGSKDLLNEKGKGLSLAEGGAPQRRVTKDWSPHLWHDRTSLGRRRSLFKAPSLDERAEGRALNKRNIQIALFAIGFIFPPCWFIASALPLPSQPNIASMKGKDSARTSIMEDLEKNFAIPLQDARYENARWWRNINRMMAFVGIIVLICVVALAVVGAHAN